MRLCDSGALPLTSLRPSPSTTLVSIGFLALGGGIGAAEAYIRGYWDADDLTMAMRILARNTECLTDSMERGLARIVRPVRATLNSFRRNTKAGSKRNIAAHYDLSNDFFALMLDRTMTYSSGVFVSESSSLEEASEEKYDRICRKLSLRENDHVVRDRNGMGWVCRTRRSLVRMSRHDNHDLGAATRLRR